MNEMPYIVTHVAPDWDAIASVWLLKNYNGMNHDIKFVNTGNPDPEIMANASAVVDTGGVLHPATLRFDHHQLPPQYCNATSAAMQVWEYLDLMHPGKVTHLKPLIELIYHGDTGQRSVDYIASERLGLHAMLDGFDRKRENADMEAYWFGSRLLHALASTLRAREMAKQMLESHTVFRSSDGLLVAVTNAPQEVTEEAFNQGAHVVLFTRSFETPEGTSHAIGVWRNAKATQPHLGNIVQAAADRLLADGMTDSPDANDKTLAIYRELNTWYKHPAGFYSGRGNEKAPCLTPVGVDAGDVAAVLNEAWERLLNI